MKKKKKKNYGVFRQWNTTQQQKGINIGPLNNLDESQRN